jgi:hypothetical protein
VSPEEEEVDLERAEVRQRLAQMLLLVSRLPTAVASSGAFAFEAADVAAEAETTSAAGMGSLAVPGLTVAMMSLSTPVHPLV